MNEEERKNGKPQPEEAEPQEKPGFDRPDFSTARKLEEMVSSTFEELHQLAEHKRIMAQFGFSKAAGCLEAIEKVYEEAKHDEREDLPLISVLMEFAFANIASQRAVLEGLHATLLDIERDRRLHERDREQGKVEIRHTVGSAQEPIERLKASDEKKD